MVRKRKGKERRDLGRAETIKRKGSEGGREVGKGKEGRKGWRERKEGKCGWDKKSSEGSKEREVG